MYIAGAFYGFKVIMIPHNLESDILFGHLEKAQAQVLIAEAGSLDLGAVVNENKRLSHVIYVAKAGNKHMAWDELPPGVRTDLSLSVWSDLVEEMRNISGLDVSQWDPKTPSPALTMLEPSVSAAKQAEFVEYQPEVSCFCM